MRARIGGPRTVLVVAPHPDDETIAAHALIARLRRRGVAVTILVVSDGAGSHRNSPAWPRRRLVRERHRETRIAMRQIGVPASRIVFLDLPDGQLAAHAAAVRRGVARAVQGLAGPVLALVPSIDDDHPDHRVVAAAARPHAGVRWLAYPVWPAGRVLRGARSLPLTTAERAAKRRAIGGYRTQTGQITDDPGGFALTARQIADFSRPQELFADLR